MRFTLATSIVALVVLTTATPQPVGQKTLAIPMSIHSGLVNADNSVNIEALNSHLASTEAKILRGLENFKRNTGASHPAALKGTQKRATGAVPLTAQKRALWYGAISVGTPANNFTVVFDTGSSDLFLPGPNCPSCAGHTIYNPSISTTAQDLRKNFAHKYLDESTVSGKQFADTVTIAGLTAVNQTLGVASKYSSMFTNASFPPDGVMGMAFEPISNYPATPVFQNLVAQGQTNASVFSFKLAAAGAELYLGGMNPALYTGDFKYTPVTQKGYWQVGMDNIQSNGQTILSDINCIIDTATALIVGNPTDVANLYAALNGTAVTNLSRSGYYSFPCDAFPQVSLTFGGRSFQISAATLNIGRVPRNLTHCVSGIVGWNTGVSFWTVGDVFLQNVYTTFDVDNARVGFAQLA